MDDVMELLARTDPVTRDPAWPTSDDGRRVLEAALRTEPGVDPDASEPSRRQRVAFYVAAAAAAVVLALAAVALVGADDRADHATEGSAGELGYAIDDDTPWLERTPVAPEGFTVQGPIREAGGFYELRDEDGETIDQGNVRSHAYVLRAGDRWARLVLVEANSQGIRAPQPLHGPDGTPVDSPVVFLEAVEWERRQAGGLDLETAPVGDGSRMYVWFAPDGTEVRLFGEDGDVDEALVLDVIEGLGAPVDR